MTAKATPKRAKKLSVMKETVKDLDIRPGRSGAVKGGGKVLDKTGTGNNCSAGC